METSEQMPNKENPIIQPEKVHDYLLSLQHPIGKFKARFFKSLGYAQEDWEVFARDIERILQEEAIEKVERTKYGEKYLVPGKLIGPSGRSATVVTVWILKHGEERLRLVTVYPRGEK